MKEIAAGGIVYSQRAEGCAVLLITDRHGRITLPKGKQEADETIEQTALREVEEETGIRGMIEHPLGTVRYTYVDEERGTVEKKVHYFIIVALDDDAEPKPQMEEICAVSWHTPEDTLRLQQQAGYENNLPLIEKALQWIAEQQKARSQQE